MKSFPLCVSIFALVVGMEHSVEAQNSKPETQIEKIQAKFPGSSVKVLLMNDVEGAMVEVKGPYNVYDPNTGKKLESGFSSSSYYMYPTADGIKWGAEFPGVYQVLLVPDNAKTSCLVGGIEYKGAMYAYQIDGALNFVNQVSLEDYVKSVFSEVVPDDIVDHEALAALAIALRTQVAYLATHAKSQYWDVNLSTLDYQGSSIVRQDEPFLEAMNSTQKMILSASAQNEPTSPISLNWFVDGGVTGVLQEILNMASNGSDAKAILAKFFPNAHIALLQN